MTILMTSSRKNWNPLSVTLKLWSFCSTTLTAIQPLCLQRYAWKDLHIRLSPSQMDKLCLWVINLKLQEGLGYYVLSIIQQKLVTHCLMVCLIVYIMFTLCLHASACVHDHNSTCRQDCPYSSFETYTMFSIMS